MFFFYGFSLEDVIILEIFLTKICLKRKFPNNIGKENFRKFSKKATAFKGMFFEITKIFGKFEQNF